MEQVGPFLKAIGDGPRQGRDALQAWRQLPRRQAGSLVEGEKAVAATAAQVVGAAVADGADETGGPMGPVAVEGGGSSAERTGYAGALVAVFF